MVLDIGCGTRKIEKDAVGIDRSPRSAADIVWDLDRYPWPVEADKFTRIHMSHIIEHVHDVMRVMGEVYRVAKDGADVHITTPHFSSVNSYTDPTHVRHLTASSFAYFAGSDFATFAGAPFRFEVVSVEITFGGNLILDGIGRRLARRNAAWYERHAAWMFPGLDLKCHLRVTKQRG
jgi:SAM-dependent methyltransferase